MTRRRRRRRRHLEPSAFPRGTRGRWTWPREKTAHGRHPYEEEEEEEEREDEREKKE